MVRGKCAKAYCRHIEQSTKMCKTSKTLNGESSSEIQSAVFKKSYFFSQNEFRSRLLSVDPAISIELSHKYCISPLYLLIPQGMRSFGGLCEQGPHTDRSHFTPWSLGLFGPHLPTWHSDGCAG